MAKTNDYIALTEDGPNKKKRIARLGSKHKEALWPSNLLFVFNLPDLFSFFRHLNAHRTITNKAISTP